MHDVKGPDGIKSTEERFIALVGLYQTQLQRMCCSWLKDASLAEDAVQVGLFNPNGTDDFAELLTLTRIDK